MLTVYTWFKTRYRWQAEKLIEFARADGNFVVVAEAADPRDVIEQTSDGWWCFVIRGDIERNGSHWRLFRAVCTVLGIWECTIDDYDIHSEGE